MKSVAGLEGMKQHIKIPTKQKFLLIGDLQPSRRKACRLYASTKSNLQGLQACTLAKNDSNGAAA